MVTKRYSKDGKICQVHFQLPASVTAREAFLHADLPEGGGEAKRMRRLSRGGFSVTVPLLPGHLYRFHYVLDGVRWLNDPDELESIPNVFGMEESFVEV